MLKKCCLLKSRRHFDWANITRALVISSYPHSAGLVLDVNSHVQPSSRKVKVQFLYPILTSLCLVCHWSIQCLSFHSNSNPLALTTCFLNISSTSLIVAYSYIAIRTLSIRIPWFRLGVDHDHHHHQREEHEGGHQVRHGCQYLV